MAEKDLTTKIKITACLPYVLVALQLPFSRFYNVEGSIPDFRISSDTVCSTFSNLDNKEIKIVKTKETALRNITKS